MIILNDHHDRNIKTFPQNILKRRIEILFSPILEYK